MAKSDVELHRQASTRNSEHTHLGDNRLKVEHLSPTAKSYPHGASDQLITLADDNASSVVNGAKNLSTLNKAVATDSRSPTPMTTRSKGLRRVQPSKHSPSPTDNGSPTKPRGVAKRKNPVKRRYHIKHKLLGPSPAASLISSSQHGALDGTIDDNSAKALKHPKDVFQDSDSSIEYTGELEREIERGATNLWSILLKADEDDTDDEQHIECNHKPSAKGSFVPSKPARTPTKQPKKARTDFFSTVLNDSSPSNPALSSSPNGPRSIAKSSFTTNASSSQTTTGSFTSQITPASSPGNDPDATDIDSDIDYSHRKRQHSFPTKPKQTRPPTTPPTRICKTTGKPFNHSITVRSTPRKRAPPVAEFVSDQIAIPTTWATVSEADKMLMSMREEGKTWEAIRKMWKEMTGQDAAPSTLPNRYNRIKANLMVLGPGEHAILLSAVNEIEKVQRSEKWGRVSTLMHSRGGGRYPAEYLQKQFSAVN